MATEPDTSPHSKLTGMSTSEPHTPTSSSRCAQCNPRPIQKTRNLVVCIDGTSNKFGQNNTNVLKLFSNIDLKTEHLGQHAYYASGIGTRPKSFNTSDRLRSAVADMLDTAVAWNKGYTVRDSYSWLARTYQEGDQIYLFGFSRGAYQVRVLAAMIHEVGLIKTPTEKQIATAYDRFEVVRPGRPDAKQIAREFKNMFSWKDLRVHFVGVWDTVSSVGLIKEDVFLSASLSALHACHFRHALALDERRVKFMPEYFHEINSQPDQGKSKYIVTSPAVEQDATPPSEQYQSTVSDGPELKKNNKATMKEVWFAGSHSDVGGTHKRGKTCQPGNVSLLWMRREAAANGLVLKPTDIVWDPNDLDFGITDSMNSVWRVLEQIPIKHQVLFSGTGDHARRLHRGKPRRIIPGQKVHASILYANTYKPQATLEGSFGMPIVPGELDDAELDEQTWESGLFEDTAAIKLVSYMGNWKGVAPIYMDRLLSMLRSEEGKQCIRNVPDWQDKFKAVIRNPERAPLDRLVAIVAYYEVADGTVAQDSLPSPHDIPTNDRIKCIRDGLAADKYQDARRVVALLKLLTKHSILQEVILTENVLRMVINLLDEGLTAKKPKESFGEVMDAVNCMLQCNGTKKALIEQLKANSIESKLHRIMKFDDPHFLTAALRMVLTMARLRDETAGFVWSEVKPRVRELATAHQGPIGNLAVEILLVLYDANERDTLDIHDPRVRVNLAGVLDRLNPDGQRDSADEQGRDANPGQQVLRGLFGLGAPELDESQQKLIRELKRAVQSGTSRERIAATKTLLKLCESATIRAYLREINMLDVFVSQLQHKHCALLAAYALAICLKYRDMEEFVDCNENLPRYIVAMLQADYFDDAIDQVEGFLIFGDFMQRNKIREEILKYGITDFLKAKLEKGTLDDIRTSLICLDILRSFNQDDPLIRELVKTGLGYLKSPRWKTQKAGVAILSSLSLTEHGVVAISEKIPEIIEMLLPEVYRPIPTESENQSPTSPGALPMHLWWMMGPAWALRILAQNKTLRECARDTIQFDSLKHLYLSGALIDGSKKSWWRFWTLNRMEVIGMLDTMIKAIDEEQSEECLMSIGDAVLPHDQHWDLLEALLRRQTLAIVTVIPTLLGVSVLAILSVIVLTPIYLSAVAYEQFDFIRSRYRHVQIISGLRRKWRFGRRDTGTDQGEQGDEVEPGFHASESGPDGHSDSEADSMLT